MKRFSLAFLILALILALSAGLFACKKVPSINDPSVDELAATAVRTVFPSGREDASEIESALLSLLSEAELEEAESVAVLTGITQKGTDAAEVLLDLKNGAYSLEHATAYRDVLNAVASSVGSSEIAGKLFYYAAKKANADLPYSLSDCEKLAALLIGQDTALGSEILDAMLDKQTDLLNEKQVNTMMATLASGLRNAVGLSDAAKGYLYELAEKEFNAFAEGADIGEETQEIIEQNRNYLLSLIETFLDGYDVYLTFAAEYLDHADARLFMGLPYEKEERVLYYGYTYADWSATLITREEYEAQSGGYDAYLSREGTVKGFTVNGTFLLISDEDAALADSAYRLYTASAAYAALDEQTKATFREALSALLTVLSEDQDTLATILGKETREEDGKSGASFDEMMQSIAPLASFDATNGIDDAERNAARGAIATYERYLHGYLPKIY